VPLDESIKATALTVDEQSGDAPARSLAIDAGKIHVQPFAVTVISW
jgi:hypothetical protein